MVIGGVELRPTPAAVSQRTHIAAILKVATGDCCSSRAEGMTLPECSGPVSDFFGNFLFTSYFLVPLHYARTHGIDLEKLYYIDVLDVCCSNFYPMARNLQLSRKGMNIRKPMNMKKEDA